MIKESVTLLTGALALCMLSMDLGLSIVYKAVSGRKNAAWLIVFTATSLGLVFFQLLDSWSALSFTEGAYNVLRYIWMGFVIADGAFLLSFVPYFTTWIIAHPWRNPYKGFFFALSAVFAVISILNLVLRHGLLADVGYLVCLFDVVFCLVVMLRNRKTVQDSGVRVMILTMTIVSLSLLPFIIAGLFVDFIRAVSLQVFFLACAIVMLVFENLAVRRALKELREEIAKAGREPEKVDLSVYHITEREVEVIGLVAEGMTNKEIAAKLSLSVNTVNNHMANIFTKTGVRSRIDLLNLIRRGQW